MKKRAGEVKKTVLCSIALIFTAADTRMITVHADHPGLTAEQEIAVMNGEMELTYELFGAKGDGITNDYEAVKAAHDYANELYIQQGIMTTVYGQSDKQYYISSASERIDIITNVDWQGSTLIIDDYADANGDGVNDILYTEPVFDIVPDMKAASGWALSIDISAAEYNAVSSSVIGPSLSDTEGIIQAVKNSSYYKRYSNIRTDFDKCTVWGAYVESETYRWIRKGSSATGGNRTGEIITFNSMTGELLTNIEYTYDDLRMIRVFPIRNDQISVGNAVIKTLTNNRVFETQNKNSYTYRNIRMRYTGNVLIHDITHILDENRHPYTGTYQSNSAANYYYGIIDLQNDAYIRLQDLNLSAHTPALRPGTANTYEGTYDLCADSVAYVYMDHISYNDYQKDILDDSRWGTIGTNQGKYVFLENCTVNRFDSHREIKDIYLKDSVFGIKGLTLTGRGVFYAENITFDQAQTPIQLRQDYGASWDGSMYFDGARFFLPDSQHSYLIYAYNTENWDFGYRSFFPDLYMRNVTVSSGKETEPVLFLFANSIKSSFDDSDADNLYYFKGNVKLEDLKTERLKSFDAFGYDFVQEAFNFRKTSYGGTNSVICDLDSSIRFNVPANISNSKFVPGNVTCDYDSAKNYLLEIYEKGNDFMQGANSDIVPESIEFAQENVSFRAGSSARLRYVITPWNANRKVMFAVGDDSLVSVDDAGNITGRKPGRTTVTVFTAAGGLTDTCDVRIQFKDVTDESQFYYAFIYDMVDKGITTGWDDGTFRPLNECNRAAVVTFLWRMLGRPQPASMAGFSDMTGNSDFDTAISWAAENGITTGWADNTFRPWNTCNRAAVITFLWRAAGKPTPMSMASFKDMTGNDDFDAAISWGVENGITTGWADNTFRPWNTCNRLAVASFLGRYEDIR